MLGEKAGRYEGNQTISLALVDVWILGFGLEEPVLFASSIKHNIMQGCPDASKEDVPAVVQTVGMGCGRRGDANAWVLAKHTETRSLSLFAFG